MQGAGCALPQSAQPRTGCCASSDLAFVCQQPFSSHSVAAARVEVSSEKFSDRRLLKWRIHSAICAIRVSVLLACTCLLVGPCMTTSNCPCRVFARSGAATPCILITTQRAQDESSLCPYTHAIYDVQERGLLLRTLVSVTAGIIPKVERPPCMTFVWLFFF